MAATTTRRKGGEPLRSLAQSIRRELLQGEPIPERFPTLTQHGIVFRRGQTVMIAGMPGGGKSLLALDLVVHAGVPALYFSADSDEVTVTARCAAMLTGGQVSQVEHQLNNKTADNKEILEALRQLDHVRFCWDTAPTLANINDELLAYIEVQGEAPHIIVIDNLTNVSDETGDEWLRLKNVLESLRQLARVSNACVIVLHHTSESEGVSTHPQPRRAIIGKIAAAPELILTVANDPEVWEYKIAAVKNRSGSPSPNADKYVSLMVDLSRMSLSDYEQQELQ